MLQDAKLKHPPSLLSTSTYVDIAAAKIRVSPAQTARLVACAQPHVAADPTRLSLNPFACLPNGWLSGSLFQADHSVLSFVSAGASGH